MSDAPVLFRTLLTASGHRFGHASLNAPASLNALTLEMVDALDAQLRSWAADPQIAGVVLDGNSEKAFCAGGDVVGLYRAMRAAGAGQVPAEAAAFFEREYRLDFLIHRYPKPLLCWGHGIVMGGGIGLMAGASHRVVTPRSRLAMPEITLGLYPDVGGSWFLPRLPGRCGLFLALTGAPLNAADALWAGLADHAARAEDQGALLEAIAATRWAGARGADAERLDELLRALPAPVLPESPLRRHRERIDALIGPHQGLATLAPRLRALAADEDPWLAQAGRTFQQGSPSSAALALALQRRLKQASLAEVFRLEYQASVGCCVQPDFAEGVRALLIDKDKAPRWQPAAIADDEEAGAESLVDAFLQPRFEGPHPLADLN
ncbi:enoyl-CoA hydratase/isomerase family protein [Roseateles sp. DAIF2]|uniref:enoyl-CoA hydratase/isomerase family protein n=1 Tax=Roseateles sp. DAIF2 TaxID=2714952 RepID=UPI0018A27B26|nr:enoyl-CoA hydratase/isomerase family protein [Roseateles sp. DAIF2]QPF75006.1 enoyl-CoA hydratase/isomerase family protein [Roseateles sp. DAIF2]